MNAVIQCYHILVHRGTQKSETVLKVNYERKVGPT